MPKRFQDLRAWQDALDAADVLYDFAATLPKFELFGMGNQLRRAALSVPSNIAEGHGRFGPKEFLKFLGNARGSLQEIITCLELAKRRKYCTAKQAADMIAVLDRSGRTLNALRTAVAKQVPSKARTTVR